VAAFVTASANAEGNPDWFGQRLFDAFAKDLQSPAYQPPAPDSSPVERRIPPAPFDSPPFPAADWQIGGTPIVGDPNNVGPWPLMEVIYSGPGRRRLEKEPRSDLRVGSIFLERQHLHKYVSRTKRKFSADLRSTTESIRTKPVRSLHRARA
jgi:hypothetical protein